MMIETVVIAPPTDPAVPLSVVKQHLRIDETDTSQDQVISTMVATAAAMINGPDGWLGRSLVQQTLELRAPGFPCRARFRGCSVISVADGYDVLAGDMEGYGYDSWARDARAVILSSPPIVSISDVTYRDQTGVMQVLDPSAYQIFGRLLLPLYGTDWPVTRDGPGAVAISYVAGYASDAVPSNITSAILLMTAMLYENREAGALPAPYGTIEMVLQPLRLYV